VKFSWFVIEKYYKPSYYYFLMFAKTKWRTAHQVFPNFLILKHLAACLTNGTSISHWRERFSTVDLHELASLDRLVFILKILLTLLSKQKLQFIYCLWKQNFQQLIRSVHFLNIKTSCSVSDNYSKEALLKGKAKYRWPPHTNWWSLADFLLKNIINLFTIIF
jgi:hypothetical protein